METHEMVQLNLKFLPVFFFSLCSKVNLCCFSTENTLL